MLSGVGYCRFTNSNYPPLEIIGLVVSRSQVKTVEFLEKRVLKSSQTSVQFVTGNAAINLNHNILMRVLLSEMLL